MPDNYDNIVYKDANVVLTKEKLYFKGEHIDLSDVIKLEIDAKRTNTKTGWILFIIGILMSIIGYINPFSDPSIGLGLLYVGYIPISLGTTWLLWFRKKRFILRVITEVDNVIAVASPDESYIKQIFDLTDQQIGLTATKETSTSNLGQNIQEAIVNKREVIFFSDNNVTVSNLFYSYGGKTLDFNLLEETKAQVERNRERMGIILLFIGLGTIYFNYSTNVGNITFGILLIILGAYFFFKKKYTVQINIDGQEPFNSVISKDISYCKKIDAAIQEAMEYNQSPLSK